MCYYGEAKFINILVASAACGPLTRLKTPYSDTRFTVLKLWMFAVLAFAGFTHKSPRVVEYMRAKGAFDDNLPSVAKDTRAAVRGRPLVRETRSIGLGCAIS